jgi:hypothetical protein
MPSTQLTLQDLYDQWGALFPSTGPTDPAFLNVVNPAIRRLVDSGTWEGCIVNCAFNGSLGYITLPRNMSSIIGVDINGWPQAVFSQFQPYMELGPGQIKANQPGCGPLLDMGDGYCTTSNISDYGQLGTLKWVISNPADAGKNIRIFGKDIFGRPVYDASGELGVNIVTAYPSVSTSLVFSDISTDKANSGIQVQTPLIGYSKLYTTIAGVDFLLAEYQPGESRPDYHRYQTGTWDVSIPIACQCRLRSIPVAYPTDWIVPGNSTAVMLAMQGITQLTSRNYKQSNESFAEAFQLLNEEHKKIRGKARYTAQFNPHGPGQFPTWNSK